MARVARPAGGHVRTTLPSRAVAVLASVLLAVAACSSGADDVGGALPGSTPGFTYDPPAKRVPVRSIVGEDLEPGRQLRLEDYGGQVVVLNVWGSWCGPCRAEADDLDRVAAASAGSGVRFLGLNVRDQRSAALDFHRNFSVSYPSLFDPPGRSLLAMRGVPRNVVPATIVLDRQHRVAAVFLAAVLDRDLGPVVDRIAREAVPPSSPGGTDVGQGSESASEPEGASPSDEETPGPDGAP